MPLFDNHVGVSLSKSQLRVVELVYSDDQFLLENVDEEEFEHDLDTKIFESNFVDILQSSFKEIISRKSPKSKYISFSLDPEFFEIYELPFESTLLKNDLIDHFRWELGKIKPGVEPSEFLIQHIELQNESIERNNYASVLYLHKIYLKKIKEFVGRNNLELRYIDYSHTSANLFHKFLIQSDFQDGLSLLKSDNYISLIILENGKPAAILKQKYNNDNLDDSLKSLLDEASSRGLDFSHVGFSLFCGNKINTDQLDDIRDAFGLELKLINPFEVIKSTNNFSSEINLLNNPSRFAASAGIALRLL